jgi:hypothetical protein
LNAHTAIHPASEHIPVTRANRITHTLTAPGSGGGGFFGGGGGSGGIPGQATLLHLDGWTVEEMEIEKSAAMVLTWPTIQTRSFDFATFSMKESPYTDAKEKYDEAVADFEEWIVAAKHYKQAIDAGSDRVDLAGGRDARDVKETLVARDIPVILGAVQRLPSERDDPYDKPNTLPGELHAAGVKIAFATFGSSNSRTLPYETANAVSFGLPRKAALEAITLNPAQILGVGDRLGSIEPGKVANLIVTDGDPLEIQTEIEHVFIKGMPVDLDNKHHRLWEKYRNRPEKEKPVIVS